MRSSLIKYCVLSFCWAITLFLLPEVGMAEGDPDYDPPLAALGPVPVPPDNQQTPEKIELGKLLFFDGRIGGDGSVSCASCHIPSLGWDFPGEVSMGYPGTIHWRNSQTVINSAYYGKLFWEGSSRSLESQAKSAATGAVAGNGSDDVMEARLALIPEYRHRFKKVFGDEWPLIGNAWQAIASFERTLVQQDTPFDRFMKGDTQALSEQQKRGMTLFKGKANCIECHNGSLFSDEKYYNLGVSGHPGWENDPLKQITFRFELYAKGSTEKLYRHGKDDPGFYFQTKQNADKGKFRTPSLRYTLYTNPYMHNGAIATLEEVVEFYNQGGGENEFTRQYSNKTKILKPLGLSPEEKSDLTAFIKSLSGERIIIDKPELPPYAPLHLTLEEKL